MNTYVIIWTDAHGERHTTQRSVTAADFIAALFSTPGCTLISATLL